MVQFFARHTTEMKQNYNSQQKLRTLGDHI